MPGLAGFSTRDGNEERDVLQRMRDMLKHQPSYEDDPLFCDTHVCGTRTHKGIVQKDPQPLVEDGLHVWLRGEFYNQENLARILGTPARKLSDSALLLGLYGKHDDFSFLRQIDGIYSAVLYDANKRSIHLLTDRYGMNYLYWAISGGAFVWASETKAFLARPEFEGRINAETLKDFFAGGYPLENRTWFNGVELVPPGTVLSWDLVGKRLTKKVYWSWQEIRPLTGRIDENDLVDEAGSLWIDSIARRSRTQGERVGITLSGGMESRSILAAMPDLEYRLQTLTIGNAYSDDVRIARRVAKLKGADHHMCEINIHNWLDLRPSAVWWSDGHYNLQHMNGSVTLDTVRDYFDINMSGLIGGVIMGASYLTRYAKDKEDEYRIINNRGRRFIACDPNTIAGVFIHVRYPFLDNALVDFMMSIPDDLRIHHRTYKRMVLKYFPRLFRNVPWQKTGLPIDAPPYMYKVKRAYDRVNKFSYRALRKLGYDPQAMTWFNRKDFHNYPHWLRHDPARTFVHDVLTNEEALYPEYISRTEVLDAFDQHMSGRNRARRLCEYMTFEIWLQQVFTGAYRNA